MSASEYIFALIFAIIAGAVTCGIFMEVLGKKSGVVVFLFAMAFFGLFYGLDLYGL